MFEPGDRVVRVQVTREANVPIGAVGTVLQCFHEEFFCENYARVQWDERPPKGGHDCGGICEFGYGWNVPAKDLAHCEATTIDEPEFDTSDVAAMINSMFGGAANNEN